MVLSDNSVALGAPGIEPRWTSSAKEGVGTAYHTSCRLWFTLSHGIVNEIYYPHVDQPNTRDFQFLITDGDTFCHEEKRDLTCRVEYPERDCVLYRLTNSERRGRYRLVKHLLAGPHRSVLLVHTLCGQSGKELARDLEYSPSLAACASWKSLADYPRRQSNDNMASGCLGAHEFAGCHPRGGDEPLVCRLSDAGLSGRFRVRLHMFLESRSALAGPQLASEHFRNSPRTSRSMVKSR